jgi:aminoglycoside phosphotransferase (APT) family kinase protein
LPLVTQSAVRVVAKVYDEGEGEAAYANMREAWHSSFGERRRPPGLPRPLDYLPDLDVLVMERLEATRLADLGVYDEKTLDRSVRLIASLHESDARPRKRRDSRRIVRSVRRKGDQIDGRIPGLGAHFREVADALDAASIGDRELRPAHGDCSAGNVLVASDRVALIDWDRFQSADPARDVAYFGSWYWVRALERGARPDWSMLGQTVAAYEAARPGVSLEERLDFHVAAGLMRMAHFLAEVRVRPELVPRIATEALSRLS